MEFLKAEDFIGPGQVIVYALESFDTPGKVEYYCAIGKVPNMAALWNIGQIKPISEKYKNFGLKALGHNIAGQSRNMIDKQQMTTPFELIVGPKSGCFYSHYPNDSLGERLLYEKEFQLVKEGMAMSTEEYHNMFQNMAIPDKAQK